MKEFSWTPLDRARAMVKQKRDAGIDVPWSFADDLAAAIYSEVDQRTKELEDKNGDLNIKILQLEAALKDEARTARAEADKKLEYLNELKAANLQVSEQQKKYSDLLQSHASLCGKIEEFMEECAKARIYWRDPKMDGSHANLVVALLDKYGKGPVKWVKNV